MSSSETEKLKEHLAAEIKQNKTAAEYGLRLLEENKSLKGKLLEETTNHEKAVVEYLQQIHNLTGKLDTKEHELSLLAGELEASKEAADNNKMKLTDIESELHRHLATMEKERNRLDFSCLEKDAEIESLKKTIEGLEEKLKESTTASSTSYSDDTNSFEQGLLNEIQALQKKNAELEEGDIEKERKIVLMKEIDEKMRTTQKMMEEELAYQESKLSDCLDHKFRLQEENEELKSEIETLKVGDVDMKRRGNSLFGEVEDNRKALENEVKSLRTQKNDLAQQNEEHKQEIKKMKYQITMLLSMCDQKVNTNYVQSLTQDLLRARGEVEELTAKLKSLTEKRSSFECTNISSPVDTKSGHDFMSILMDEKDRKIEALKSELNSVSLSKTTLNNRVIHAERQLYQVEKQNSSLKTEIMNLKLELEDLKKDTLKPGKTCKPTIKVEKIPGFKGKTNTTNIKETATDSSGVITEHTGLGMQDKENVKLPSPNLIKENATKPSEGTKKVRFVTDHPSPDNNEKQSKLTKMPGKKVNVAYTLVTSEDASTPDNCAQQ